MEKRSGKLIVFILLGIVPLVALLMSGCASPEIKEGKELYHHYCTPCHGSKGRGDGFNAEFVKPAPTDHTDSEYMGKRSNKKLFKVISKGGRGAARAATMPAYGNVLSEKEIWEILAYIRTLHSSSQPKIEIKEDMDDKRPKHPVITRVNLSLPEGKTEAAMIKKGKKLFRRNGCKGCHRIGEKGGRIGPELSRIGKRLNADFIYKWVKNPQYYKKETIMPSFWHLKDNDVKAIVYFLKSQNAPATAGSRGDPFYMTDVPDQPVYD
ncbi:MAG: cytochrome c [Nitrospirota bacterium]